MPRCHRPPYRTTPAGCRRGPASACRLFQAPAEHFHGIGQVFLALRRSLVHGGTALRYPGASGRCGPPAGGRGSGCSAAPETSLGDDGGVIRLLVADPLATKSASGRPRRWRPGQMVGAGGGPDSTVSVSCPSSTRPTATLPPPAVNCTIRMVPAPFGRRECLSSEGSIGGFNRRVEVDRVTALLAAAVARPFATAERHVVVDAAVGRLTITMPAWAWRA